MSYSLRMRVYLVNCRECGIEYDQQISARLGSPPVICGHCGSKDIKVRDITEGDA